jgi:hypothetical protein
MNMSSMETWVQRSRRRGTTPRLRSQRLPWTVLAFEVALITAAACAYFLVRSATEGSEAVAIANAGALIAFEQTTGLFAEIAFQDLLLSHQSLVTLANWVYIFGHWPFIGLVAAWLLLWHPSDYRRYRNAFLASGGIGLAVFAAFPVAPPRFLDLGLVDTVTENSRAYRVLQPAAFTNQFAALPSLHVGWNLLIGIALFRTARSWALKLAGVVSPLLMAVAVLVTANHFIVDIFAGVTVALIGLAIATHGRRCLAGIAGLSAMLRERRRAAR